MTDLFLFGTLCYKPLLKLVLGYDPKLEPGQIAGFRSVWAKGESFPMLVADPSGSAAGLLVKGLSSVDMARLDFYEAAFDFELRSCAITTPAGATSAQVYFPVDPPWEVGDAWELQDWVGRWGQITLLAAAEVMRAYGKEDAKDVARRFPIIRARAQSRHAASQRRRPALHSSDFRSDRDIEILRQSHPYENFFAVSETYAKFRQFDGTWAETGQRAIFHAADAVTVLPYDPVRDAVMLVEQIRVGVLVQGEHQPWLLEPIAGIVDFGESYEKTAHREALEEAHITLKSLHKIAEYYPTPGGVAQYLVSYLGLADLPEDARRVGGLMSEGENIRNLVVSFDDLMKMLESGEIANAPLVLSAQWLALNREKLRRDAGQSA